MEREQNSADSSLLFDSEQSDRYVSAAGRDQRERKAVKSAVPIRLGTLNLNNRCSEVANTFEFIMEQNLDIICLNECGADLTSRLNNRFKNHGYKNVYESADYAGNVIFSRLNMTLIKKKKLMSKCDELRSMILVEIQSQLEDGSLFSFGVVGTHLEHINESDRLSQFQQIYKEV